MENTEQPQSKNKIRHVVLVGSGKGGVGKSTISVNLALALKKTGAKVGLLDSDIHGPSIPRMVGAINQKPQVGENKKLTPIRRFGVSFMSMGFLINEDAAVIWRGPMLFKAIEQFLNDVDWGELDYLVIDLPPGTGDVALTISQKVQVSGAIVVSTPQNISLTDAKRAIDMFQKVNIPLLGVVENMSAFKIPGQSQSIRLFPPGDLDTFLDSRGVQKLAQLPFFTSIGLSCEAGIPIMESAGDGEEVKIFADIAQKVIDKTNAAESATAQA